MTHAKPFKNARSVQNTAKDNAEGPSEFVRVCVMDTGIGISSKDREAVFDAFFQVSRGYTDKTTGTGLGLPLSRQLVALHGGRLWVESEEEGKGSTFCLEIPVSQTGKQETEKLHQKA